MTAITKMFEVRDDGTTMVIIAIKPCRNSEATRWGWARSGYGTTDHAQAQYILVGPLHGGEGNLVCDPYKHGRSRTLQVAHEHLLKHDNFMELESGEVIDVEFLLGESDEEKKPEREQIYDAYLKNPVTGQ